MDRLRGTTRRRFKNLVAFSFGFPVGDLHPFGRSFPQALAEVSERLANATSDPYLQARTRARYSPTRLPLKSGSPYLFVWSGWGLEDLNPRPLVEAAINLQTTHPNHLFQLIQSPGSECSAERKLLSNHGQTGRTLIFFPRRLFEAVARFFFSFVCVCGWGGLDRFLGNTHLVMSQKRGGGG